MRCKWLQKLVFKSELLAIKSLDEAYYDNENTNIRGRYPKEDLREMNKRVRNKRRKEINEHWLTKFINYVFP